MAYTSAHTLAKYILYKAQERGVSLTNLKLQKLLYYCQAWHLVLTDSELFDERIEAWVHGPVVPPVFGVYKEHRWNFLPVPTEEPAIENGHPDRPIREHVSEVLDAYGGLTGPQLEALTHKESPWKLARNDDPVDMPSTEIISSESMRAFYGASERA